MSNQISSRSIQPLNHVFYETNPPKKMTPKKTQKVNPLLYGSFALGGTILTSFAAHNFFLNGSPNDTRQGFASSFFQGQVLDTRKGICSHADMWDSFLIAQHVKDLLIKYVTLRPDQTLESTHYNTDYLNPNRKEAFRYGYRGETCERREWTGLGIKSKFDSFEKEGNSFRYQRLFDNLNMDTDWSNPYYKQLDLKCSLVGKKTLQCEGSQNFFHVYSSEETPECLTETFNGQTVKSCLKEKKATLIQTFLYPDPNLFG